MKCQESPYLKVGEYFKGKYIRIERYPGLKFDRLSGKQAPSKKGNRTYRYLFSAEAFHKQRAQADYKDNLLTLIDRTTMTKDIYEKCRSVIQKCGID